ncbi:MAG: sporulation protein YqfD [Clostridia bacterium]|nr:sporulation protein YqfD [Clostridia bacterium]
MIPSIPYLIYGYIRVSTPGEHAAALLELCRRCSLPYENFTNTEEGISLRFTLPTAERVITACRDRGIPLTLGDRGGLPLILKRLFCRPGLVVGGLLGILLILLAQSVLWDIRITGNTTVSDRAIRESLAACGLSVGTPVKRIRADVIENNVLLMDDRLAWLSVNRKGTVVHVEVRESVPGPKEETLGPRDMVAGRGGIIEYVELESGNVRVTAGQTVGEGEVLVSGIYDSAQTGIRLETAKARVFARTTRDFSVTIPLTVQQKRYLSANDSNKAGISREKSIIFFGNHIKFSKKSGNIEGFCDIIDAEESWGLIDGVGFPISTRTVWYLPYEMTSVTRSYAEAEELAYFELSKYIAALPGGATLLSETVTVTHGKDALTLHGTLTVIEDIAVPREILVEE